MIQSMKTGITGMNAYQQALGVTSNNIANASTIGFKGQKAVFTDLLYTNTMGGSATELFAGTNPMSVGNGSAVGAIRTDFSAGGVEMGGFMDAALTEDGFFVVGDSSGGSLAYTRNGSFSVSSDGRIINANGQYVLGFTADANGNIISSPTPVPIEIEIGKAVPGVASTKSSMSGNLPLKPEFDSNGTYIHTKQMVVFNDAGEKVTLTVEFELTEDAPGSGRADNTNVNVRITMPNPNDPDNPISVGTTNLDFSANPFNPIIPIGGSGATGLELNLSNLTMLDTNGTVTSKTDGSAAKIATGYGIGDGGAVLLQFSDGSTQQIAQLAVATFANNDGLMQQGNGTYTPGLSAGQVSIGVAGENGAGNVLGGRLESSNVDLANEFVDLMIYQKGFQGSTKIIKTSDDILNEVVNLIR